MEVGIFVESLIHNYSPGWGSPFEYNEREIVGITFLLLLFPSTAIIIFIILLTSCIKNAAI